MPHQSSVRPKINTGCVIEAAVRPQLTTLGDILEGGGVGRILRFQQDRVPFEKFFSTVAVTVVGEWARHP
jgi:hypothetical protein